MLNSIKLNDCLYTNEWEFERFCLDVFDASDTEAQGHPFLIRAHFLILKHPAENTSSLEAASIIVDEVFSCNSWV